MINDEVMANAISHKGRALKTVGTYKPRGIKKNLECGHSFLVRNENSDELLPLDLRKTPCENFYEILMQSLNTCNRISKPIRLSHLNNFVRLLVRFPKSDVQRGFTQRDFLICVRCLLLDDEREIRTAALRSLRYLIRDEADFDEALRLKLDVFIVRCLDIVLDNHLERMQCIRLLSHLTKICPQKISPILLKSLIAVCVDGSDEGDKLTKAATAILCELVVLRPQVLTEFGEGSAGVGWLVSTILGCHTPRLVECLVAVLSFIFNDVRLRRRCFPLEQSCSVSDDVYSQIFAPLIDANFKLCGIDKDDKTIQLRKESDLVLENCRAALMSSLRTWPGLISCLSPTCRIGVDSFLRSPLQTVFASLCLDSEQIQETVVDALCDILNLPYKNEHWDSWERTLELTDISMYDEFNFGLNQEFVVFDARLVLPDWNVPRTNLTNLTNSLVLCALIDAGLINSLLRLVVPNPNRALALKILLLLSDIMHICGEVLPTTWRRLCFSIPSILQLICDDDSPTTVVERQNARLIVSRLEILAELKRRPRKARTLQLETMIFRYKNETKSILPSANQNFAPSKIFHESHSTLADRIHELIKESRAMQPYSNYSSWEWSFIHLTLNFMAEPRVSYEDSFCTKFIGHVLNFYDPQSGQFCKMTDEYKSFSRTGCLLMKVLAKTSPESTMNGMLRAFLAQLAHALLPDRLHMGLLSAKNILSTSCADYFLFLGELSSTNIGKTSLEKCGIIQRLNDLLASDAHDAYAKLILSSFDYSKPGHGRAMLQKALISNKDTVRIFATEFLRVLGKLKAPSFDEWGLDLLLNQMYDVDERVVRSAVDVLEELLNSDIHKAAYVKKRPSVLPLGDVGVLLNTYLFSNEKFVTSVQSTSFVDNEIERWKQTFNVRYAEVVDELMHEAVSNYKRSSSGRFPRHSSARESMSSVYLPPHLYGQLMEHSVGAQLLLVDRDCMSPLLEIIHFGGVDSDVDAKRMKSALWALGHVCSSDFGFASLTCVDDVVACVVKIAEECTMYSIRGVAFYALNLIARSSLGAERLARFGWITNNNNNNATSNLNLADDEIVVDEQLKVEDFAAATSSMPTTPVRANANSINRRFDSETTPIDATSNCSAEFCRLSVRSCISCELCRLNASSSSPDYCGSLTPSFTAVDCPTHLTSGTPKISAVDAKDENSFPLPIEKSLCAASSRCCACCYYSPSTLDVFDEINVEETGFRRTTRSRSLGGEENEKDFFRKKALTLPSANFRHRSAKSEERRKQGKDVQVEEEGQSWSSMSSGGRHTTLSLCDHPTKSASVSSDLFRLRFGLRKRVRTLCALPTLNFFDRRSKEEDELANNSETMTDVDVNGIKQLRMLRSERALGNDAAMSSSKFSALPESTENGDNGEYSSASVNKSFIFNSSSPTPLVCLPVDITLMSSTDHFEIKRKDRTNSWKREMDKNRHQYLGLAQHVKSSCFRCSSENGKSADEFGDFYGVDGLTKNNRSQEVAALKETLRLVCLISVRRRYSEQGLLRLKQETPQIFRSQCLYADVCHLMSSYNFRLAARRFLQELFSDVDFGDLKKSAQTTLAKNKAATKFDEVDAKDL